MASLVCCFYYCSIHPSSVWFQSWWSCVLLMLPDDFDLVLPNSSRSLALSITLFNEEFSLSSFVPSDSDRCSFPRTTGHRTTGTEHTLKILGWLGAFFFLRLWRKTSEAFYGEFLTIDHQIDRLYVGFIFFDLANAKCRLKSLLLSRSSLHR